MDFATVVARTSAMAGRLMLENGAETHRVEDTMERICSAYGIKAQTFVTLTGIFITCGHTTELTRITKRGTNLAIVSRVNSLSREIAEGKTGIEEATNRLKAIEKYKPYPIYLKNLVRGIGCGAFTYLVHGDIWDCLNAFISGILLSLFITLINRTRLSGFMASLIESAMVTLCVIIIHRLGIGDSFHFSIIGAIMPLLPGLGLTNAVRDIMYGDYMCGSARFFDACVTALAVAFGVASVLIAYNHILRGVMFL